MTLPIIRPDVQFDEVEADLRAIFSSGLLTGGPFLEEFEGQLAGVIGVPEVVATSSATTALHLSLYAHGVGPGDEVLVSDFTFPATGNVIVELGAVPVLVDIRPDEFGIDLDVAASLVTDRTRAILAVDPFGQPLDLSELDTFAARYQLVAVEDAACALGSWRNGRAPGSGKWPGCFSFHPRKVITTGEGGAISVRDAALAARLRSLRSHGAVRTLGGMTFEESGFNYRLGEVPAAIGLSQLRRLDAIVGDRQRTARDYELKLSQIEGVELRLPGSGETWSYQSFVVMLDSNIDRSRVAAQMRAEGIETTLGTYAMHSQPAFARFGYEPGSLRHSYRAQQQSLTLPLVPHMAASDVSRVVESLAVAVKGDRRG